VKPAVLLAVLLAIVDLVSPGGVGRGENWPGFRGPTGLGYTQERNLPLRWGGPEGENVLWKAPLRGQGHASPIVWDDRVFVSTVLWPPVVQDRTKSPGSRCVGRDGQESSRGLHGYHGSDAGRRRPLRVLSGTSV
jgi:hypothetical protein